MIQSVVKHGDLAQLVEHLLCKQGVRGSTPLVSTNNRLPHEGGFIFNCETRSMDEYDLMLTFGAISMSVMGAGALALSLVTWFGKGHRFFAIMLSLTAFAMGLYFVINLSMAALLATILGGAAFVISVLPSRKERSN